MWEIVSNFVAFLENLNFTIVITDEPYILQNFLISEFAQNFWGFDMAMVIFDTQGY